MLFNFIMQFYSSDPASFVFGRREGEESGAERKKDGQGKEVAGGRAVVEVVVGGLGGHVLGGLISVGGFNKGYG